MREPPGKEARIRAAAARPMEDLLAIYARYATLVRHQEEALEAEDLQRFEDLARARKAIQEELGAGPPPPAEDEEPDQQTRALLERIHEELREAGMRDARLMSRLQEMKRDAREHVRTVDGRGKPLDGYLAGEKASRGEGRARLNVRL